MTRQENFLDLFLESYNLFIHFLKFLIISGVRISRARNSLIRDSLWFAFDCWINRIIRKRWIIIHLPLIFDSIGFRFARESWLAGESWFATNQNESIRFELSTFPENSSVIRNLIRTWIRKTSVRKVFDNPITFKVRSYRLSQSHWPIFSSQTNF